VGKKRVPPKKRSTDLAQKENSFLSDLKFTMVPIVLYPVLLIFRFPLSDESTFRAYMASLPLGLLALLVYRNLTPQFVDSKKIYFSLYCLLLFFLVFPFRELAQNDKVNNGYFPINEKQSITLVSELVTGNLNSNFPYKNVIFIFFLATFYLALYWLYRTRKITDLREIALSILCSLLIFSSTWKNTSWGSPYSWVPTLEKPRTTNYTYVVSHFPNGEGLVNADEFVNSSMLKLFNGEPFENLMLLRRPFAYFLISQTSSLFNSLQLWIAFNLVIWGLAAISTYLLLKFLGFDFIPRAVSTTFVAVFPLSAVYVGQSTPYFTSTFLSIFITFFFLFFLKHRPAESTLLLTLMCVIASLTYDAYFAVFFITLAALRLKFLKKLDAFKLIFVSFLSPFAYGYYFTKVTAIQIPDNNQSPIFKVITSLIGFLKNPNLELLQTNILASFDSSVFVFLCLLTPLIAFFYASVSVYLFYIQHKFLDFSRELIVFVLIGFYGFQTVFNLANNPWIGAIPRVNSVLFIVFVVVLAEFNKVKHFSIPIFLLSAAVILYLFLLNLRMVPGWRMIIFNLVQGGWAPYGFE
jgi:hypothetical protein